MPKVSVAVMTYNHQHFIHQCLDSILTQSVNFALEIVVSDDNSTDNTQSILKKYKAKHPGIIKLILRDKNVGGRENMAGMLAACSGEYIAHLDGDDYAFPRRLQTQANYLDSYQDCVIVHHDVNLVNEDGALKAKSLYARRIPASGDINDLLETVNSILESSIMYRKSALREGYLNFPIPRLPDMLLNLRLAQHGRIAYLKDILGCYRIHSNSVLRTVHPKEMHRTFIIILRLARDMKGVTPDGILVAKASIWTALSNRYAMVGDSGMAWKCFWKAFFSQGFSYNKQNIYRQMATLKLLVLPKSGR